MRNSGASDIIAIVIIIIAFIVSIYVFFKTFWATQYSGRLTCKVGYTLASLSSFLIQPSAAAIENLAIIPTYALAITTATLAAYSFIKAKVKGGSSKAAIETSADVASEMSKEIKTPVQVDDNFKSTLAKAAEEYPLYEAQSISSSERKVFIEGLKDFGKNIYRARKLIIGEALAAGILYGFSFALNKLAESLQIPFLDALCPEYFTGIYPSGDENTFKNFLKRVVNQSYLDVNSLQGDDLYIAYVVYKIAYYTYLTYGETIGSSVAIGRQKLHYGILVWYNYNFSINYRDILVALYTMNIGGKNPYRDMYGNDKQSNLNEFFSSNIFSNFSLTILKNNKVNDEDLVSAVGKPLISAYAQDLVGKSCQVTNKSLYILPAPGIYLVGIYYNGPAQAIDIISVRLGPANNPECFN